MGSVAQLFSISVQLVSVRFGAFASFPRLRLFIGHLGIVDHDVVELSNLQRQVLHTEETLGLPKVESAANTLKKYVAYVAALPHKVLMTFTE